MNTQYTYNYHIKLLYLFFLEIKVANWYLELKS